MSKTAEELESLGMEQFAAIVRGPGFDMKAYIDEAKENKENTVVECEWGAEVWRKKKKGA